MTDQQWKSVLRAQALYRSASPIIKYGTSRRWGEMSSSWRHPQGWQALVRVAQDEQTALVVLHAFAHAPESAVVPLKGRWQVKETFSETPILVAQELLTWTIVSDFSAQIVILEKVKK